jgi:hypothetical protein
MSSEHEAEIRASVAAHADLGPGYDDAVAEGLVERIGAEVDKRIDARLAQFGAAGAPGYPGPGAYQGPGAYPGPGAPAGTRPGVPTPAGAAGMPGAAVPPESAGAAPRYQGYQAPAGYQGYQGYIGPMLPPGYQLGPPPARPSPIGQRNVATTVTALGSIALGVLATAIVSHAPSGGQAVMVLLIWAAIAIVNVVYARRH